MTYKWDAGLLQQMIRKLNKASDDIQATKMAYRVSQKSLQVALEGDTGTAFMERMDADIRNFDILIDAYKKEMAAVQKVIMKCYRPCEETIKSKLTTLESNFK